MEERSKNPKRVEAGKKLSEKNKEIKEFYIKKHKVIKFKLHNYRSCSSTWNWLL